MSGCEQAQERISRMLDGDLSREETAALAEHLKTCEECAALYAAFASLSETLGADLEEPPEGLRENVMAAIRREEIRKKNRLSRPLRLIVTAAACAALVFGVTRALPGGLRNGTATASMSAYSAMDASAEAVMEESAMAVTTAADGAENFTVDLSDKLTGAALRELLGGDPEEPDAEAQYTILVGGEDGVCAVYALEQDGAVYYTDPASGQWLRSEAAEAFWRLLD